MKLVILQIELRNNKLEMQSVCSEALIEELDKLLERLRVPSEVCLIYGIVIYETNAMLISDGQKIK